MEYDADDPTIYNSCMYYGSTGEAYGNKQTIGSYISGTYGQNMTKVESIDTNGDVTLVTANVSDTRYTNITAYEWYAVG